ncbi:16S rRNA (uracil(1498)-N(3))-methyltransferase [Roseateles asaccharophilus]|uniref:Ribosomal RNA small subunit methyltransferase E n=1 Tax=Roseateles asaccharophilus TaxID=582607 RepID=A0ABU2ADB6_9BURK|nr:16S rRNA (uracil(1498)-N(3))-methyltransferase [Roseateles asaccharophilus]MDR7335175.1 16S rRNA (uracil1498-N3)-methyltransferase [Roseateles asaccharophilus]
MPRFFVDTPLAAPGELALPPGAARHVQVLRLQPGDALTLFDGSGPEWQAEVTAMGRSEVRVRLLEPTQPQRELARAITLAVVMPANDRMDFLVEKATELGAAALQPLVAERSVLRLAGERADKKRAHWQGVAIAAAEQSGRTVPTHIAPVMPLSAWLAALPPAGDDEWRGLLSPRAAQPLAAFAQQRALFLSGSEGGLSDAEEDAARARGFAAVSLGPRILRADTAPLAVLSWLALS